MLIVVMLYSLGKNDKKEKHLYVCALQATILPNIFYLWLFYLQVQRAKRMYADVQACVYTHCTWETMLRLPASVRQIERTLGSREHTP